MHMKTPKILSYDEYNEKIKKLKTSKDASNFIKSLVAPVLQEMLEVEMTDHLGYSKNNPTGNMSGNSRNGYSQKKIITSQGQANLNVPRDRNGKFEPMAVRKYETIDNDVEEKIISMYAKGLTTRDINSHMNDVYGVNISASMVSSITDKVIPLVKEWQSRPLSETYPIVYLDGIHFKVRENGKIASKCAYIILGINTEGFKEILGIWVGENEGAKYWMGILSEIKSRGVKDILIACIDGLIGFEDAVKTIYPDCIIQSCIVHQIRNTTKYIPHKHKKKFCQDLKLVYQTPTEESGLEALNKMKKNWKKYEIYLASWETNWHKISPMFGFPEPIRRIIYTTNTIEGLNRQFRKVTKTTSIFPHNEALLKLLWLAQNDIAKKWTSTIRNWGEILAQLAIIFPEKITV